MNAISRRPGNPRGRADHLGPVNTGISWYADYPEHYQGDAHYGSEKKGRYLLDFHARNVARLVGAIKRDRAVPALLREFYAKSRRPVRGRS